MHVVHSKFGDLHSESCLLLLRADSDAIVGYISHDSILRAGNRNCRHKMSARVSKCQREFQNVSESFDRLRHEVTSVKGLSPSQVASPPARPRIFEKHY
jgi:hypothetical protein